MNKTKTLMGLTPEQIGDHFWVEVTIDPNQSQQEQMLRMQQAQAFRAAGPTGLPMYSEADILSKVIRDPHAEEALARAQMQMFEATDPEVKALKDAALQAEWREQNKETVKKAENFLQPDKKFRRMMDAMTPEEFEALKKVMIEMGAMQAQTGLDPQAQVQAAEAQAQAEAQALPIPPTALPYQENGPSPEVAPTQMGLGEAPQPMEATPDVMAMQARRGRPQP